MTPFGTFWHRFLGACPRPVSGERHARAKEMLKVEIAKGMEHGAPFLMPAAAEQRCGAECEVSTEGFEGAVESRGWTGKPEAAAAERYRAGLARSGNIVVIIFNTLYAAMRRAQADSVLFSTATNRRSPRTKPAEISDR
jgi:hypothetical protein